MATTNDKKKTYGLGLFALLLVIAYFTRDKWLEYIPGLSPAADKPGDTNNKGKTSTTSPTPTTTPAPVNEDSELKNGSRGASVEELQKLINQVLKVMYPNDTPIGTDGIFGPQTEGALKKLAGKTSISLKVFKEMFKNPLAGKSSQEVPAPYIGAWHAPWLLT